MSRVCPKCGYVRRPADQAPEGECPACGVIYEKFLAAMERAAQGSPAPVAVERQPASIETVALWAMAAVGVLLVVRWLVRPLHPVIALLSVPFFFCIVPVISYYLSGGLYLWNRWTGRFDFMSREERPTMTLLLMILFAVFAVVFAVMLFHPAMDN